MRTSEGPSVTHRRPHGQQLQPGSGFDGSTGTSSKVEVDRVEYDELVLWRAVFSHTEAWRRIQLARALLSHHGHTSEAAALADLALRGEAIPKPRQVAP